MHVTFVIGQLSSKYFKHSSHESLPEYILTTRTSTKFNSIGTSHILPDGNSIIKIFSEKELMDGDLDELFERWSWVHKKVWKAYPQLLPNQTYPPVKIEDGFYYVNSFEPFISVTYFNKNGRMERIQNRSCLLKMCYWLNLFLYLYNRLWKQRPSPGAILLAWFTNDGRRLTSKPNYRNFIRK